MAIEDRKDENVSPSSTFLPQRSEELGINLMNSGSTYSAGIAGNFQHNDILNSQPVFSVSSFPQRDMNEIPQCYSQEIVSARGNSMTDASQFNKSPNLQIAHHYRSEDSQSFLYRPNSDFLSPKGYIGQPYQYSRHDYLENRDNMMNADFNVDKLHSGGKFVTVRDSSAVGPQMVNRGGEAMSSNSSFLGPIMNSGMPSTSPNQGGALPLNYPGKLDGRFMNFGGGSMEAQSNTHMSRINITDNSERKFLPPDNTCNKQMGIRSFSNPGFDRITSVSGFHNNNELTSYTAQNMGVQMPINMGIQMPSADGRTVISGARPGFSLGSSYTFQRPAVDYQSHYSQPVNWDLGIGVGRDADMGFADVGFENGFARRMALSSLPSSGSQADIGQSRTNGQQVPSYLNKLMNNQSASEQLPTYNMNFDGRFSLQSSTNPPLVMATGSTTSHDPSSTCNLGQSQVSGSMQQYNTSLGPVYTSGQVSRPSLKRGASRPQSSTIQVQRRKILTTQPFTRPSVTTWTQSAPSVPNTPQTVPPLVHTAPSLAPQTTHPFIRPFTPTRVKSALSGPNMAQTIPPLVNTASSITPQTRAVISLPPHDKRPSPFLLSPQTSSVSHPSRTPHSLPNSRWRRPFIPSAPMTAPVVIKQKGQTPEPSGYKCLICKRDLSYTPEGPISQPSDPPPAAVLSCGHTFHDYCLQRITPDDQSKDPPCIPCALRESEN
ncbi:hypothetical protein L6164_004588 [Bauhinia variegata]|uniref:Uncharacterized protein n=1 Tax=Bauhinia variegata TaxID=167791 RepID=A0ACB9Q4W4_BAUVA|nr:hypothetical protein L6164_004588 [Bauhinia variegata]